ncbi:MAG: T9SS type A sorting domain-containing protein [Sphingobacteriia bacterium]|nr:T9SS type A sorting domain-containing protein [Sphingobacteriia bacterium]
MKKALLLLFATLFYIADLYPQATFNTGTMEVSVNQYGRIRFYDTEGIIHLQRASILVGTSPTTVFDYQNDAEEYEPTVLVGNPASSDFEIYGAYDNSYSGAPPNVIVRLNAFGWNNGMYTIVRFRVQNNETGAVDASIGLDIIPELNEEYGYDTVTYIAGEEIIRFHRGTHMNMGMKLLGASLSSLYSFEWYDGYEVDSDYWTWMHNGSLQNQYISTTIDGPVTITAQEAVALNPGQMFDVYYAMALGLNEDAMVTNIAAAEEKYNDIFVGIDENEYVKYPGKNFPNPFNKTTTISYWLKNAEFVQVKVFDACGRGIATLVNGIQQAGLNEVLFDAGGLSGGLYYYTITSGNQISTHKMVIKK